MGRHIVVARPRIRQAPGDYHGSSLRDLSLAAAGEVLPIKEISLAYSFVVFYGDPQLAIVIATPLHVVLVLQGPRFQDVDNR